MDLMYIDHIEISEYEGSQSRITRLNRVIGYVQALGEHYGNDHVLDKVSKLHDHKGTMTVTWKTQPTDGEKEIFLKAWKSSIGDGADNVEHEVR